MAALVEAKVLPMSCRVCQQTDPQGRPTKDAAASRKEWGCDAPMAASLIIDCVRCGGTGHEPGPWIGPCGRCRGDRRGERLDRCPHAPGQIDPRVDLSALAAIDAQSGRYPAPGPAIDQSVGFLEACASFAAAQARAREERAKIDKQVDAEIARAAAAANGSGAPMATTRRSRGR